MMHVTEAGELFVFEGCSEKVFVIARTPFDFVRRNWQDSQTIRHIVFRVNNTLLGKYSKTVSLGSARIIYQSQMSQHILPAHSISSPFWYIIQACSLHWIPVWMWTSPLYCPSRVCASALVIEKISSCAFLMDYSRIVIVPPAWFKPTRYQDWMNLPE